MDKSSIGRSKNNFLKDEFINSDLHRFAVTIGFKTWRHQVGFKWRLQRIFPLPLNDLQFENFPHGDALSEGPRLEKPAYVMYISEQR